MLFTPSTSRDVSFVSVSCREDNNGLNEMDSLIHNFSFSLDVSKKIISAANVLPLDLGQLLEK